MRSTPFFVSLLIQIGEKKLPQEFGKENLTVSLTKSPSIGYFPAFFAFIIRCVMQKTFKAISEIYNPIERSYQGPIKNSNGISPFWPITLTFLLLIGLV